MVPRMVVKKGALWEGPKADPEKRGQVQVTHKEVCPGETRTGIGGAGQGRGRNQTRGNKLNKGEADLEPRALSPLKRWGDFLHPSLSQVLQGSSESVMPSEFVLAGEAGPPHSHTRA